ncbi:hypothetical protein ACFV7R_25860 [Streptomyces sp. NPDC059866]|uniref:hypothetical protein n=1 Tax=Streptomyces sp. NPDC059866 TaxID=3346978 RepID=UPI003652994E
MESQGFVRRVRYGHDGRGWRAAPTDAGPAILEEAWPTNLAAVRRHFLDHLAGLDLGKPAAALRNVATEQTHRRPPQSTWRRLVVLLDGQNSYSTVRRPAGGTRRR